MQTPDSSLRIQDLTRSGKSPIGPVEGLLAPEEMAALRERVLKLAHGMDAQEFEGARRAARDLFALVHSAGAPGRPRLRRCISDALLEALGQLKTVQVRRQLLGMISEISGEEAVRALEEILLDVELGDDARRVLERIPGTLALKAMQSALGRVPIPSRRALAVSLKVRGVPVKGLPDQKLVPSRKTRVQPKAPPAISPGSSTSSKGSDR